MERCHSDLFPDSLSEPLQILWFCIAETSAYYRAGRWCICSIFCCTVRNSYISFALLFFLVICDLMVITMIDADTQEIPPQLNVILLLLGIPAIWVLPGPTIIERVIGLFAISVPMFILMLFNGFGGGGVKMMFAAGFLLGWKGVVAAFFVGIIVGGAYAIYLLASKKKGRKEHFAFGPFLAFGVLVALTQNLGDTMISMYIDYVKSMMTATY